MAERVIKPKVKTGNNTTDDIKIPYNVLSNPPDLSVYVTTENTTQNIGGKKTVVTPPDTDDSTQIANTAWVRSHNQAIRGFDGVNYYTVDGVKKYYPADNYFLVAYTDHCTNWKHVCAEMDVVDLDTRRAVYKLKVSGLLESATSNNITTYTNKGNIGVTDSFGERLNTGTTDINNEFFLVCRTTNKGRVRYEIWYNQRYAYNRHKFYFSVDEAHACTGITEHFTWNKMRIDNGTDVGYAKAGVTAYMESGNINPTYIPTSSWGVDVFKTALSDDESYTNVTIFNNNLYSTTQVGVSTILNTTPYIDAKIKGYSGYKTIPSAQKTAEYRILSEDKGYLGGIRYDKYTDGDSGTRLCVASTLSGASNSVMIYATKGTASTKNTDSNIWSFVPATDDNIALGGSGNRWLNGYITNIQRCKVINGGGGNSLIQQNSDTAGADIIVGSTDCVLKILGSGARPTYRQGENGTYANLALQSDIPTNYVTTDTDWQEITSTKKFLKNQLIISNEIDIDANAPAPEANQYSYIDFLDKNEKRIGIVGALIDKNKRYGAYLQAGNVASIGVSSTPDGFGYSYGPIPPNKDNTNKLATTSWTGRRYKSISDFGFTSQTTVKAIVQKIIDNWYEYCTFACTNDNFNNFSDTPDGYGTLIIEVGSNALRPFISFTKQIGDSNSYKYWQANIVRGANNQVTEIQWYELALKQDVPPMPFCSDDLSTGTFGSTQVFKGGLKALYFEDRSEPQYPLYGVFYTEGFSGHSILFPRGITAKSSYISNDISFVQYVVNDNTITRNIYYIETETSTGKTSFSMQKSSGTFRYKVLK